MQNDKFVQYACDYRGCHHDVATESYAVNSSEGVLSQKQATAYESAHHRLNAVHTLTVSDSYQANVSSFVNLSGNARKSPVQLGGAEQALEVSLSDHFQCINIQRLIGNDSFEPSIFVFKLFQSK